MNKYLRDVQTFPADARQAWRMDGGHGLWEEIAERTLFRIARSASYNLYERDLATIKLKAPPAGVEIRELAPREFPMLKLLMTERKWSSLDRDRDSRVVFVARRDGRLVGYSWWTYLFDTALDFSPLTLPSDAVFHGYVHVSREERGQGTSGALYSGGEMQLLARGTQRCWSLAKTTNVEGTRSVQGKWSGNNRLLATLTYSKSLLHSTRALVMADAAPALQQRA